SAAFVLPTETLILNGSGFRLGADAFSWLVRSVRFAERVSPSNERYGFFVVHRHATKRDADMRGCSHRIRFAAGALGVHVDEPHLSRAEGLLKSLTVCGKALVSQPFGFWAPIDVSRLKHIHAPAAESQSLEPHGFKRNVSAQHHEIGPRKAAAILLLDGPEQPARFVEVRVVRPAIERSKADRAIGGAAATVRYAVSSSAVPGKSDHQPAVVPKVSRPPILGSSKELSD